MIKLTLDDLPEHVALYPRTQVELDRQVAEALRRLAQPAFSLTIATYHAAMAAKRHSKMPYTVLEYLIDNQGSGPSGYIANHGAPVPPALLRAAFIAPLPSALVTEPDDAAMKSNLSAADYREYKAEQRRKAAGA